MARATADGASASASEQPAAYNSRGAERKLLAALADPEVRALATEYLREDLEMFGYAAWPADASLSPPPSF